MRISWTVGRFRGWSIFSLTSQKWRFQGDYCDHELCCRKRRILIGKNVLHGLIQLYILSNIMEGQEKQCEYLDEYRIIGQLGSGYQALVYQALDPQGQKVAIKKFKSISQDTGDINEELRVMEELHHENLIKLISVRQNALFTRKIGLSYRCFAIVLEYAAGGELFDFVAETGRFSEKVARTYFHQMMNGIHYMHEKGYAHRDIKPENLLLSDTFVLKIADFGFSCLLRGRDGSGVLKTRLGTEGYMAPQILSKEYDGRKVDIFAAGIILFIIYSGNPPFERATANDPYYKLIKEKRMDLFWESHSRKRKLGFFSVHFRDLFEKMVAFDPCERLSIYDIAKHPWVKSIICTHTEIIKQFQQRKFRLQQILQEKRKARQEVETAENESISVSSCSERGERISEAFAESYFQLKQNHREWPLLKQGNRQRIIVNNRDVQFVFCHLKSYLSQLVINLSLKSQEQQDLIEEEEQSGILSVIQISQLSHSLHPTFSYKSKIGRNQISHKLQIHIQLGKSQLGKTVIQLYPQHDHFYFKVIAANLKNSCFP